MALLQCGELLQRQRVHPAEYGELALGRVARRSWPVRSNGIGAGATSGSPRSLACSYSAIPAPRAAAAPRGRTRRSGRLATMPNSSSDRLLEFLDAHRRLRLATSSRCTASVTAAYGRRARRPPRGPRPSQSRVADARRSAASRCAMPRRPLRPDRAGQPAPALGHRRWRRPRRAGALPAPARPHPRLRARRRPPAQRVRRARERIGALLGGAHRQPGLHLGLARAAAAASRISLGARGRRSPVGLSPGPPEPALQFGAPRSRGRGRRPAVTLPPAAGATPPRRPAPPGRAGRAARRRPPCAASDSLSAASACSAESWRLDCSVRAPASASGPVRPPASARRRASRAGLVDGRLHLQEGAACGPIRRAPSPRPPDRRRG